MMYFCGKELIILFILLQLKAQVICSENDVTKHLNESISNIFAINAQDAIELISTVRNHKMKEFEYNVSKNVNPFQTKFFFQNICIWRFEGTSSEEDIPPPQLHWEFIEKKMSLLYEDLRISLQGMIGAVKGENISKIRIRPGFKNFTLTAVGSYIDHNNLKFSHNITYNGLRCWMLATPTVYWFTKISSSRDDLEQLDQQIIPASLAMIHRNIQDNRYFSDKLKEIFQTYEKPRKEIISKHPDFLTNPQRYYYLIPEYTFFRFILKDIVIRGLSNFKSFKCIRSSSGIFTHTLHVRDVRGNMTLDYRSKNATNLELDFQIDYLFVSKKEDSSCVFVQAKYYTVVSTKTNVSLSTRPSLVIMNGLESAIASSLLPSMKIGKTCDLGTSLEEIEISNVLYSIDKQ
ncbi:uncharacterized protein LOC135837294 isoform X2 [Planococcus citri]|uniref:uncharacterized protein LOC135837294 isoform X2 n=1 Tax=Planococcus citri TaxID=170843 RepID=UPI0031F7970F